MRAGLHMPCGFSAATLLAGRSVHIPTTDKKRAMSPEQWRCRVLPQAVAHACTWIYACSCSTGEFVCVRVCGCVCLWEGWWWCVCTGVGGSVRCAVCGVLCVVVVYVHGCR